jgi:DivIVA domain-containing protein
MAGDEPTDVLPILNNDDRGFDPAIRGYDRAQVDSFVARLDADLRTAQHERDTIAGRSADIAAQLANAHAQVESLRRQLRSATEQITPENVDAHVANTLKTTHADASRIRVAAQEEAERVRNGAADAANRTISAATAEAERIIEQATEQHVAADTLFHDRMAEIEGHRAIVTADLAASTEAVRAEEERLTSVATAERERLDAEAAATRAELDEAATAERLRLETASAATRALADEDFELTLRARRTEQYALLREERAVAEDAAATLIADAHDEVTTLHAVRDDAHGRLDTLADELKVALTRARAVPETGPSSGG